MTEQPAEFHSRKEMAFAICEAAAGVGECICKNGADRNACSGVMREVAFVLRLLAAERARALEDAAALCRSHANTTNTEIGAAAARVCAKRIRAIASEQKDAVP